MASINSNISKYSKIQIYFSAAVKALRGYIRGAFFNKRSGRIFIGKHVRIMNSQYIHTGKNVKFEDYSEIQGLALHGLFFAENVTIGRNVMIRPSSYYGVGYIGDGLEIGKNSSIGPNGYIGAAGSIKIGENVMIGPNVTLIAENHNFSDKDLSIKAQGVHQKGIKIEDNVWIGANVTILDGVVVHSGSVIGADALLTKSIPQDSKVIDKRDQRILDR